MWGTPLLLQWSEPSGARKFTRNVQDVNNSTPEGQKSGGDRGQRIDKNGCFQSLLEDFFLLLILLLASFYFQLLTCEFGQEKRRKRKDALYRSLSYTHPNTHKSHFILPSGPADVCVCRSSQWVPLVDSGWLKPDIPPPPRNIFRIPEDAPCCITVYRTPTTHLWV